MSRPTGAGTARRGPGSGPAPRAYATRPPPQQLLERLPRDRGLQVRRYLGVPIRRDLQRLGMLHRTNKAWTSGYLPHYQQHLAPLRREPVVLLEIGIGGYKVAEGGASLCLWQSYFPRGAIHGLDLHPKRVPGPRITVHQGSQADRAYLDRLAREVGPFDVVIDDGSHVGRHIRTSFEVLFPHVAPGGWYIIEDMATAYVPFYGGGPPGTPGTSVQLAKDLVDSVNRSHFDDDVRTWPVDEVHLYDQLGFFRKGGRTGG